VKVKLIWCIWFYPLVSGVAVGLRRIGDKLYYVEKVTDSLYTFDEVKDVVYSKRSEHQVVEVLDIVDGGLSLYIDNHLQVCVSDEWIYHEALVHPAMLFHGSPHRVLIIGGGDGGALREVLKYDCVESVVLVELDPSVIELVEKFMPMIPDGAFKDPRVKVVYMDGRKYIEEHDGKFDVIIVDVTDLSDVSAHIYTREFYRAAKRRLNENGVLVTQSLGLHYQLKYVSLIYNTVNSVFRNVRLAKAYVRSFIDEWTFTIASDSELDLNVLSSRFKGMLEGKTKFLTEDTLMALFAIPPHIRRRLSEDKRILTDENKVVLYE